MNDMFGRKEEKKLITQPYDVLDVSRYIINRCNNVDDILISNLKLQKVLYFVQAYFLVNASRKCFDEKIEAWNIGPVVAKAYREYKHFGSTHIPPITYCWERNQKQTFGLKRIPYDNKLTVISEEDQEMINTVIDGLKNCSATALTAITHNQKPWKDAYNRNWPDKEITVEAIVNYFSEPKKKTCNDAQVEGT